MCDNLRRVLATLGLLLGVAGVVPAEQRPLARVGEEEITVADFLAEVERRSQTAPGIVSTPERRRMLLDEMVRHRALVARARALGYDRHRDVVAVAERMMVETYRREHVRDELAGPGRGPLPRSAPTPGPACGSARWRSTR